MWGDKYTVSLYFKAGSELKVVERLIEVLNREFPSAEFAGIRHDPVQEEPKESIAT